MAGGPAFPPIPVSPNDRLRNLAEAAAWLGMGQSTLRQALYEGRGPRAVKFPGSDRWRFRPSDLEAYVKAGEISPKQGMAAEAEAKTRSRREVREKSVKGIIPFTDLSLRSLYLLARPRTHETSGQRS